MDVRDIERDLFRSAPVVSHSTSNQPASLRYISGRFLPMIIAFHGKLNEFELASVCMDRNETFQIGLADCIEIN